MSRLFHDYFEKKKLEAIFKFRQKEPQIGEFCIAAITSGAFYWAKRTSQNYYQSGNTTIPAELIKATLTIKEMREVK